MTNPITPSPELVQQWQDESPETQIADHIQYLVTRAAQWGSDQELEACCEWLQHNYPDGTQVAALWVARRPKPPSLKEQALKMLRPLSNPVMLGTPEYRLYEPQAEIIRRALEALDD
jgi:hypothetical protein